MTGSAWAMLAVTWTVVITLAGYFFYRVLTAPGKDD